MSPNELRMSWEHNRGLALPVRVGHVAWAAWAPVHRTAAAGSRRHWALPLLYGALAAAVLFPLDGWLLGLIAPGGRAPGWLGGDVRRELEALQQFGQGGMTVLVALVVWLMDPPNRRRLLDWLAAIGIAAVLAFGLKMLIGRPRPVLDEPRLLLGPLGMYPLGPEAGVAHAWEFWREDVSRLWSMPSSHTVYAVVAAAMLAAWYPRLRWLMAGMAALVAVARVLFGAHYPGDVAAGVAVGVAAAGLALRWNLSGSGRAGAGAGQGA